MPGRGGGGHLLAAGMARRVPRQHGDRERMEVFVALMLRLRRRRCVGLVACFVARSRVSRLMVRASWSALPIPLRGLNAPHPERAVMANAMPCWNEPGAVRDHRPSGDRVPDRFQPHAASGREVPVGAIVGGQPCAEDRLLALAGAYQAATGWHPAAAGSGHGCGGARGRGTSAADGRASRAAEAVGRRVSRGGDSSRKGRP